MTEKLSLTDTVGIVADVNALTITVNTEIVEQITTDESFPTEETLSDQVTDEILKE
jgi:hypothetical protein